MTLKAKHLRVDLHTHIIPKRLPDLSEKYGYPGWISTEPLPNGSARMMLDGKPFRDIECNCWDADTRVEDCVRTDVDVQVISTIPVLFNYWAKPAHCLDLSKYLNDDIAQTCSLYPSKFIGLATLPMQAPELAVQELHRCINELGLAGIQIGSHINDWNLDAPELEPIWNACENLDVPVFIHPWDMEQGGRMKKYWFPWLIGMPCETTIAICSLIFGGVLERHPKLKVCLAHGGGSFPFTLGRIEHGFQCRPDIVAVDNTKSPLYVLLTQIVYWKNLD
jgi:aminocarboxymuconate-semialdehyde decarboxylase